MQAGVQVPGGRIGSVRLLQRRFIVGIEEKSPSTLTALGMSSAAMPIHGVAQNTVLDSRAISATSGPVTTSVSFPSRPCP